MAYIEPEFAGVGTELGVMLVGECAGAVVVKSCLYDARHIIPNSLLIDN